MNSSDGNYLQTFIKLPLERNFYLNVAQCTFNYIAFKTPTLCKPE
jgi:hypothetical protein